MDRNFKLKNMYLAANNYFVDIDVDRYVEWERSKVALRGEKHHSKVICFPIFAILSAIGNPTIDYFSLDVEGSELPILRSIPWQKVTIKVSYVISSFSMDIILFILGDRRY